MFTLLQIFCRKHGIQVILSKYLQTIAEYNSRTAYDFHVQLLRLISRELSVVIIQYNKIQLM